MARTYTRDSHGRFAGTGGARRATRASEARTVGAAKGAATRKANDATTARLKASGLTAVGGRLAKSTASKYTGTADTKRSRVRSWASENSDRISGSRTKGAISKTRRAKAAPPKVPATLPGQKLQHYPHQPVNSGPARKAPKRRPVLDAIARPILKGMNRKKKKG